MGKSLWERSGGISGGGSERRGFGGLDDEWS